MQFWCAENTVLERSITIFFFEAYCFVFSVFHILFIQFAENSLDLKLLFVLTATVTLLFSSVSITIYSKRRNWLFSCFILIRRPKAILPRSATSPDRPPFKYSSESWYLCTQLRQRHSACELCSFSDERTFGSPPYFYWTFPGSIWKSTSQNVHQMDGMASGWSSGRGEHWHSIRVAENIYTKHDVNNKDAWIRVSVVDHKTSASALV